jgi:hypothetical protein
MGIAVNNKDNLPADPSKVPRVIRPLKPNPIKALNERVILTPPEIGEKRLEICKKCDSFSDWACKTSNQFMPKRVRIKSATCPRGLWSSYWGS